MRWHFNPVSVAFLMLALASQSGLAQEAVPADRARRDVLIARAPLPNALSVIGSDGIFYRVRHELGVLSLPVGPTVVPPPPSSVLEAIDLNPNSNRPVDSIAFAGLASQLGIGKDNRLYLVVNVVPEVTIASGSTSNLVPVPAPQSRLYVIPTPFPPRALGSTLGSIAAPASLEAVDAITEGPQRLDTIVQADFEGHVQSLAVKAVGDLEYLYLTAVVPSYRFPTLTNASGARTTFGPIMPLVKLLIFTNNGRKIKEVGTE